MHPWFLMQNILLFRLFYSIGKWSLWCFWNTVFICSFQKVVMMYSKWFIWFILFRLSQSLLWICKFLSFCKLRKFSPLFVKVFRISYFYFARKHRLIAIKSSVILLWAHDTLFTFFSLFFLCCWNHIIFIISPQFHWDFYDCFYWSSTCSPPFSYWIPTELFIWLLTWSYYFYLGVNIFNFSEEPLNFLLL